MGDLVTLISGKLVVNRSPMLPLKNFHPYIPCSKKKTKVKNKDTEGHIGAITVLIFPNADFSIFYTEKTCEE